jgi:hypothetical protein
VKSAEWFFQDIDHKGILKTGMNLAIICLLLIHLFMIATPQRAELIKSE